MCVSIKDEAGTRIYLTNSKQQFRGAARQNVKEPIRMMPSGDPKAAAEFQEIQASGPRWPGRWLFRRGVVAA